MRSPPAQFQSQLSTDCIIVIVISRFTVFLKVLLDTVVIQRFLQFLGHHPVIRVERPDVVDIVVVMLQTFQFRPEKLLDYVGKVAKERRK